MSIAIVTDSTAYIPKDLREKHNIYTVSLSVIFGTETYREEIDITTEQFYEKVARNEELPSTSQPAIGEFVELFEKLKETHDTIISIHLSRKFSGTYDAAESAGNMVDGVDVHVYDSELSCTPQGLLAIAASEMACAGKNATEIIAALDDIKAKTRTYFMVDDLSHLHRGGRLNRAQAILGSVLNIKPILHIEEGLIVPFEKIRTRKKAINRIMSMLEDDSKNKQVARVVFIHANNERAAIELRDQYHTKFPNVETIVSYFGPVIGTHLGEGSVGVAWYTT
ncbi:MAG TPA: DegV family protein [Pseudogracilibacillus sp.]|nr:DegV family protein [Pseudogracilibacillus sp.]